MRVEVLYIRDCPHHAPALAMVREALRQQGLDWPVEEIEVRDPSQAQVLAFIGSPTIRINGHDIEPLEQQQGFYGFGCRTYRVDGRTTGVPPAECVRAAIRSAAGVV